MTFTLDEIMDALSEAFAQSHPRTSRDCEVEKKLRDILSARLASGKGHLIPQLDLEDI